VISLTYCLLHWSFTTSSLRHTDVIKSSLSVYLFTVPVNLVLRKIMGFSDEHKIVIKNLHDSARNSLWDFFNDTSSTACELTMLILSISVTFSVTCLTVASLITKSCQQRWPIHSCSFYKVVH